MHTEILIADEKPTVTISCSSVTEGYILANVLAEGLELLTAKVGHEKIARDERASLGELHNLVKALRQGT